jgi:Fe2+ or Zn2+ uptake regulation protein
MHYHHPVIKASASQLRKHGLKDTLARRTVLHALARAKHPLTTQEIQRKLQKDEQRIGIVTVYRVIEALERARLVHRHVNGSFSACSQPDVKCGHVLLSCISCGTRRETHDHGLCRKEESLSKRLGFSPVRGAREIVALCSHCSKR